MNLSMINKNFNKLGGIERYLVELVDNLSKIDKGIDIELYVNKYDEALLKDIDGYIKVNKIKSLEKPSFFSSLSFCINSSKANIKNSISHAHGTAIFKADIVTAHSCHKAWYIYSVKNVIGFKEKMKKILNPSHYATMMIEKIQYSNKKLKKVIAISNVVKQELINFYGVDEKIIEVIYNGTNVDEFNPINIKKYRNEIRQKHNINNDDIVISFVGAEFRRKGLKYILQAMEKINMKNLKLMVIGGDKSDEFIDLANNLGLIENIIFVGKSKEVEKYYAASDMFVFPTVYEAFGQVITEAMATGIPVITSKYAGAAEIARDNYDILLLNNPTDISEIENKMRILIDNKQLRSYIGKNARKTIESYTWKETAKSMLKIYRNIK